MGKRRRNASSLLLINKMGSWKTIERLFFNTYLLTYLLTFLFTHATPRSASASLNVCVQHKQLNG